MASCPGDRYRDPCGRPLLRYRPHVRVVNDILKERWLHKGIALRESEQYDEALTAIEKAIQLDPNYVQACCEKGIIFRERPFSESDDYKANEDYEEALDAFSKAIQLDYAQACYERAITRRDFFIHLAPPKALQYSSNLPSHLSFLYSIPFHITRTARQTASSSPDVFLNLLGQWFVHRLEIDGGLAKENQQCLEIDIELHFNRHAKSASINGLRQIFIR